MPNNTQIYIQEIQDIQDKYKTARRGPSPAQARGRAGPGRPVRGPGLGPGLGRAGPAAAWYFVFVLDILNISWMNLDIFFVYF